MEILWLRHGTLPIVTLSTNEFFDRQVQKRDSIIVLDVNEKEYWEGIQLILGRSLNVILHHELQSMPGPVRWKLFRQGLYYTFDPLDRV